MAKPWQYEGPSAWVFISMPKQLAQEIRGMSQWQERGWGRFPIQLSIANYTWNTSMWFDTKQDTYLIPLKSVIRKKLDIQLAKELEVTVTC